MTEMTEGGGKGRGHASPLQTLDHRWILSPKMIYLAIGGLNYVFYAFRMKFFTEYYGFPEHVSGLIQTVWNVASLGGATLWNNAADWWRIHRGLLVIICLAMGVIFEVNLLKHWLPVGWWPLLAMITFGLYGLLLGGILPLADYHVLQLLKGKFGKSPSLYGRQALFGMVAYGLITLFLGRVLDTFGVVTLFRMVPVMATMAAAAVWYLGATGGDEGEENWDNKHKEKGGGDQSQGESCGQVSIDELPAQTEGMHGGPSPIKAAPALKDVIPAARSASLGDYLRMLADRRFLYFIYVILSTGMGRQSLAIFLPHILAKELGLTSWDISLALAGSCTFSLLFYFISPFALRRLGVWLMLLIAQLALTIRLIIYSRMQPGTSRWIIQGVELLNGFAYSFTQVAGVQEAARLAPEGWGAAFQGAYACAHVQIPAIFVTAFGGFILHHYGGRALLKTALAFPLISATVLTISIIYERLFRRVSKA